MTEERIREFESMGFEWATRKTDLASIWNERVEQLCEYKVQFGHCVVPVKYPVNPKLGKWVSKQRQNYKVYWEGKPSDMTEQRIQELERVEFKWSLPST